MTEAGSASQGVQIVRLDQGGVNARILAREAKADFRRVEAASVKIATRFYSAEGKRIFVRMFATLQLNTYFISVIARTRLDHEDIQKIELALRDRMEAAAQQLDHAIDGAEALFAAHGINAAATYDAQPLEVEVGVLSSMGRRYLELIGKLDQLMPLLQTLEIHEVITTDALDVQRASLKRQVRDVANAARSLAMGLRRRMNGEARAAHVAPRAEVGGEAGTDVPQNVPEDEDVAESSSLPEDRASA
ncbi:AcaB family transcriptional regulator [Luteimonas sp. BDR2-5]|uniref:AcaB family transcriptional regulator n=1 Tax=Proluteimonas luteida TaxID=2878685 RepID=UPI001E5C2EDB|nr:AcaB family transcriptional regulator [Luteimonas sp. BDR2-5]MCD9026755.1 AcaB family transcriptional regulator [Luteimonas sp. BDR2-5]